MPVDTVSKIFLPVSLADFLANYWEKKPLLLQRKNQNYYTDLMTVEMFDQYIASTRVYPHLSVASNSIDIYPADFTRRVEQGTHTLNLIEFDKIYHYYQIGASIILNRLDRLSKSVSALCAELEYFFNYPVQANAYLTPANSQSFDLHRDGHDVLILQLEGEKHWQVYDPVYPIPLRNQDSGVADPGELLFDTTLQAGDLLYLPRGYYHQVKTASRRSLHITIGIHVKSYQQVVRELLMNLLDRMTDLEWRQAPPPGFVTRNTQQRETLNDHVAKLLKQLNNELSITDYAALMSKFCARDMHPRLPARLHDIHHLDDIDEKTCLEHNGCIIVDVAFDEAQKHIFITFYGKTLTLPVALKKAVEYILSNKKFEPATIKGSYSLRVKVDVARLFVKEGLLKISR